MISQPMQDLLDAFWAHQKASAGRDLPALEERRASFAPAGRLNPVPSDVSVTDVSADRVPVHWLSAPGSDPNRVLLFLH